MIDIHIQFSYLVAIYVLYQLGVYLNKETWKVFEVGYTAVPGAVKRGQQYLSLDRQLAKWVKNIIPVR